MKILIITQKIDEHDDALSFFVRWIDEFAKSCESVVAVCLQKGSYTPPANVHVVSLGKEEGKSRIKYLFRFFKTIFSFRNEYDVVFVHMNPIYVVLGGVFWRIMGKKIALWYTHRSVDLKLKIAEKMADIIFTAAPESFRLPSNKLKIVGHGIDVSLFQAKNSITNTTINIMHVGRITRIKNCDVLIRAAGLLKKKVTRPFVIEFVGKPITSDDVEYQKELIDLVATMELGDCVVFRGGVPNTEIPAMYAHADITVNMTPTGGIDKSVLESMATGVPVVVSNTAFADYFKEYAPQLTFTFGDPQDLAQKLYDICTLNSEKWENLAHFLRTTAEKRADISSLIRGILENIKQDTHESVH